MAVKIVNNIQQLVAIHCLGIIRQSSSVSQIKFSPTAQLNCNSEHT